MEGLYYSLVLLFFGGLLLDANRGGAITTILAFIVWLFLFVFVALDGGETTHRIGPWLSTAYTALISLSFSDHLAWLPSQPWRLTFWLLVAFKFVKVVIHTISYMLYRPTPIPEKPTLTPNDVTVIVPTIGDLDSKGFMAEFTKCIESILRNTPNQLIISTIEHLGEEPTRQQFYDLCVELLEDFRRRNSASNRGIVTELKVISISQANKRAQLMAAARFVKTQITCYADDHVFWPANFLQSCLANFEDNRVGLVGTVKRVRRDRGNSIFESFLNYIAVIYLERHNFECTASSNIDGGVFVISGRTALIRSAILKARDFLDGFLNETWWFGKVGPMKVDDDNFITRYVINHGYKTVFHNSPHALMETTLGISGIGKFKGQLIRWVRTTWRSNSVSLFAERTCWRVHPWTTYAMFISSFFNFALFYDLALFVTLYKSGKATSKSHVVLLLTLVASKLIKPFPHLCRYPRDIVYVPFGIAFGYLHSFLKLWALLTAKNIDWSGRKGIASIGVPLEDPTTA